MKFSIISSPQSTLVSAHQIGFRHAGRDILSHVDLGISAGEIVTLIGLNGSGKSTLVKLLIGLLLPTSGRVHRKINLKIGYSPQNLNVDPSLPLSVKRFLTLNTQTSRPNLLSLLDEVGVGDLLDYQLSTVSGGELHRIMLARALLRKPELLVLDEPLSGVDVTGQAELYRLISVIRDRYGCGVLLVSHDLHLVMAATDRVACLNQHICCTGHPESVATHPEFVALFGKHVAESMAIYTHHHDHTHTASGDVVPLAKSDDG